tara:strand:+ start:91 stop:549 length:459 start_codon:yes stop_codon:yes gene_type:complete
VVEVVVVVMMPDPMEMVEAVVVPLDKMQMEALLLLVMVMGAHNPQVVLVDQEIREMEHLVQHLQVVLVDLVAPTVVVAAVVDQDTTAVVAVVESLVATLVLVVAVVDQDICIHLLSLMEQLLRQLVILVSKQALSLHQFLEMLVREILVLME